MTSSGFVFLTIWPRFLVVFFMLSLVVFPVAAHSESAISQPFFKGDEIQSGVFLVANPKVTDVHFGKSVVLILKHDAEGSSGLVINHSTAQTLPDLLPNVEWAVPVEPIFEGGPVLQDETLTLLFQSKSPPQDMSPIFEDVYVTQKARIFARLLQDETQSEAYRLYAGYAGWASGQLESEIRRGDWHVIPADVDVLFDEDMRQTWSEMFARTQRRFVKKNEFGDRAAKGAKKG